MNTLSLADHLSFWCALF